MLGFTQCYIAGGGTFNVHIMSVPTVTIILHACVCVNDLCSYMYINVYVYKRYFVCYFFHTRYCFCTVLLYLLLSQEWLNKDSTINHYYSALSIYRGIFSSRNSRKTSHSLPARASYRVSFVREMFLSVIFVLCAYRVKYATYIDSL